MLQMRKKINLEYFVDVTNILHISSQQLKRKHWSVPANKFYAKDGLHSIKIFTENKINFIRLN